MEKLYNNIEAYLAGTLSKTESDSFEAAMAKDPDLAKEVALHQKIGGFLANKEELAFRKTVASISSNITPTSSKTQYWATILISIALLALLVFGLWYWTQRSAPENDLINTEQPAIDTATKEIAPGLPIDSVTTPKDTVPATPPPAKKPNPKPKKLDPYKPNVRLEALLDPANHDLDYEMVFRTRLLSDSLTTLIFEGGLRCSELPKDRDFYLELFDNKPGHYPMQPIFKTKLEPIEFKEDGLPRAFGAKKEYNLDYDTLLPLKEGVYYYQVRLGKDIKPLYVNKFEY